MKIFIYIVGVIVAIGLVAWGVLFFVFAKRMPSASNSLTIQSQNQSGVSLPVQNIPTPQNSQVAKDFFNEVQSSSQIALGGTVLSSQYALQVWSDTNGGGEALMEQVSSTAWTLVSLGGGEWSVFGLAQEGVPISNAEQLVGGLTSGMASSSVGSPMTIPAGETITFGTSNGSVTMNNFYKSADYLAPAQQSVVIKEAQDYGIFYNVPGNSFALIVFSIPFEATRQTAEASFLSLLGISQQDACKLKVYEGVPNNASNPDVGMSLPLSFCVSGAFGASQ